MLHNVDRIRNLSEKLKLQHCEGVPQHQLRIALLVTEFQRTIIVVEVYCLTYKPAGFLSQH